MMNVLAQTFCRPRTNSRNREMRITGITRANPFPITCCADGGGSGIHAHPPEKHHAEDAEEE
jgi:hypothetical protein